MKKANSQRWHFKKQIRKRFGVFCNNDLYFYVLREIQNGNSEFIMKQSNTRTIHKVFIPFELLDCKRNRLRVFPKVTLWRYDLFEELAYGLLCCPVQANYDNDFYNVHIPKLLDFTELEGIMIYVAYDKLRSELVTCLPYARNDEWFYWQYDNHREQG